MNDGAFWAAFCKDEVLSDLRECRMIEILGGESRFVAMVVESIQS